MNIKDFRAELYPITVQVVSINGQNYLLAHQPDFDYRISEPYRPQDIGQTEMMIIKIRREIASKASQSLGSKTPIPQPTKLQNHFDPPTLFQLTTKDASVLLGVSEMTVRRLSDQGILPSRKTAKGHRRFCRKDIDTLLSSLNPSLQNPSENQRTCDF